MNNIDNFINFCDDMQVANEGKLLDRIKTKLRLKGWTFKGTPVDSEYDVDKYESLSDKDKKEFDNANKLAIKIAEKNWKKVYEKEIRSLAEKAHKDVSEFNKMLNQELCGVTLIEYSENKPSKFKFRVWYNDQKKNPELFNGQCIKIQMKYDNGIIESSHKIFDSSKEWD